jgi:hypothetical protein
VLTLPLDVEEEELKILEVLQNVEDHARFTTVDPGYQFRWPPPNLIEAFAMYPSTATWWTRIKYLVIEAVIAHNAHLQRQQQQQETQAEEIEEEEEEE